MTGETMALDHEGREIIVSQGSGGVTGPWGAFRIKPSGSLQRLRSIAMVPARRTAAAATRAYAELKGWTLVGGDR